MTSIDSKIRVKRHPERGQYDKKQIYKILDKDFSCHVSFIYESYPIVIPTIYGRKDDILFIHGASVSRMLESLKKGIEVSVSISIVNGLVLARSAFDHSLNYESVIVFGKAELIENKTDKFRALKTISDQVLKGRWEEVRQPSEKELRATKVLAIPLAEASAKVRTGPPIDNKGYYDLDVWAGVIPITRQFKQPITDPKLKKGIKAGPSVQQFYSKAILKKEN